MLFETKKMKKYLAETYKKQDKNTFIIEIDLEKYIEVFSEWDKSPFTKRDIHPELETFLSSCSDDIPLKYKLSLHFYLPESIKDEKAEKIITKSIRNYYDYSIFEYQKKKREEKEEAIKYLMISLVFLFFGYLGRINFFKNIIFNTINEVLFIGGWVLMWEFFSKLFLTHDELRKEYKKSKRILEADIVFKYEKKINTLVAIVPKKTEEK
jgi:hypothetical protein